MNNKKVIFFDIDGTLLTPGKRIVESSTIEILKELSKSDEVDIYISSGRGKFTLGEIDHILPYFTGLNLGNGGELIINGKVHHYPFKKEDVESFVTFLNEHKISYGVLTSKQNLRMYFRDDIKKAIDSAVKCEYQILNTEDNFYFNDVIEFWILDQNDTIEILKQKFTNLTFFNWGNFGCDVVPLGRSKATGIKTIIELMDYDYEYTYAIGDSDNDVPMFKAVNTSIAMNNGSINAKKSATYVTDDVTNDGVKKAIDKYILKR